MSHILCVSYDEALLNTRRLILESQGYRVTAAWGFQSALHACKSGGRGVFDLFVLGHSIPSHDKQTMIHEFRAHCSAPVIALKRVDEPKIEGADYYADPDPAPLVDLIATILRSKS
jgi:DNA-binding response OmpR family regulator